ncbi:MAG: sel1 repeat family protein [Hyphomonadaceae bacterium]|nr:sel1 repeat family protein [Hyphomonadaceae bacterium]
MAPDPSRFSLVCLALAALAACAPGDCGIIRAQTEWRASKALERCAAKGDAKAQSLLGMIHWSAGRAQHMKCTVDPNSSFDPRTLAESDACQRVPANPKNFGLPEAMSVADLNARGRTLLEAAAASGDAIALNELGLASLEALNGTPVDYAAARSWFDRASAAGDSIAPFNLARMHHAGLGAPRDDAAADRELALSQERGYASAACARLVIAARARGEPVASDAAECTRADLPAEFRAAP